jgi:hypothetical protein
MRQFGGVRKRCLDVFRPQSRIASEDLFSRGPLCQVIENHGDWNSSASGAKIASTNSGVAAEVLLPDRHVGIVPRRRADPRASKSGMRVSRQADRRERKR